FADKDFYRRARENAERADLVVVNHALLLGSFLGIAADEEPFTAQVVCDEAHTLEEAATLALEQRVEEQRLRRILQAIYNSQGRGGVVLESRRRPEPARRPGDFRSRAGRRAKGAAGANRRQGTAHPSACALPAA